MWHQENLQKKTQQEKQNISVFFWYMLRKTRKNFTLIPSDIENSFFVY